MYVPVIQEDVWKPHLFGGHPDRRYAAIFMRVPDEICRAPFLHEHEDGLMILC